MIWNILYVTYLGFTWIGQEVDQDGEKEKQLHHKLERANLSQTILAEKNTKWQTPTGKL